MILMVDGGRSKGRVVERGGGGGGVRGMCVCVTWGQRKPGRGWRLRGEVAWFY